MDARPFLVPAAAVGGRCHAVLSHHKNLNLGDFLVDDRCANGARDFGGELVLFGSADFGDWAAVTKYLLERK
ncbi:hypothetical protein ACWDUM_05425 [Rhodococcus sp. NPDC003322]